MVLPREASSLRVIYNSFRRLALFVSKVWIISIVCRILNEKFVGAIVHCESTDVYKDSLCHETTRTILSYDRMRYQLNRHTVGIEYRYSKANRI